MRNRSIILSAAALSAWATAADSYGQITSLNLANYQHSATFDLPTPAADEASAITYNWNTGNLVVLGDEGDALAEVTRTGTVVSTMTLTGFADTEGITYIGGGQFVLDEERLQDVYRFTYAAGGTIDRATLATASLGPTIGNIGIEGISYDPRTGKYVAMKEKTPQAVYDATVDFAAGTATTTELFTPPETLLGALDLSDVQLLATVPSLIGTADEDNLLIYSQESSRLMEVTRSGSILSTFDFSAISATAEGVTIDSDGTIFVCDETPRVYVLTPVPEPAALLSAAVVTSVTMLRRRRIEDSR